MNEGGLTNRIYETVVWLSLCVVIILHLDLMCITLVARQMILVTCRDTKKKRPETYESKGYARHRRSGDGAPPTPVRGHQVAS